MDARSLWPLGVIEGFFGRPWSWQARTGLADFLAGIGCNSYVYAPKNDAWLRRRWHEPFPAEHLDALTTLSQHYRATGLTFGMGLSPFELYRHFDTNSREHLLDKLAQIDEVDPDILCILFDDMAGDLEGLARRQVEIVETITSQSRAARFVVCPTYYSSDPRLAKVFGTPPQRYLEELGAALDPRIDVFWTGPEVISRSYPRDHLREVAQALRRKPLLWDNYPVNDTRRLSNFLNVLPFANRGPELRESCSGHLANPMNQAHLSRLPLYTLPRCYAPGGIGDAADAFAAACDAQCQPPLAAALRRHADDFQTRGLESFDTAERDVLRATFAAFDHPMAAEVVAWLDGAYTFDPACLTE